MVVMDTGYRVFVCETVTGKITADLPVASLRWGTKLNDAGTLSVSVRPLATELSAINFRGATAPLKQSLGVAYGDQIIECGPIWARSYDDGEVKLEASGLWTIFDRRKVLPGSALLEGAAVTRAVVSASGSLGDIARELVRISIEDNPYGGGLNIVLPAVIEGGPHTRTYKGYDLGWTGARLRELTKVQNGPDIRFRPRFSAADPTVVEWVLEYGSVAVPTLQQAGGDWIWDGGVEGSGIQELGSDEDASEIGALAWVPGSGQERGMKLASARNLDLIADGYPWTELDDASKDVEDAAVLQIHAERLLDDGRAPWITFPLKVRADVYPVLGTYQPGDWARIVIPEHHPTLDAGEVRVRIMALDGDGSETVTLTIAPELDLSEDTSGESQTAIDSDDEPYLPGTWSDLPPGTWTALPDGTWKEL